MTLSLSLDGKTESRPQQLASAAGKDPAALATELLEKAVASAKTPASFSPGAATVYQRLSDFDGKAEGLPADLARNHDHYLHGQPRPDLSRC